MATAWTALSAATGLAKASGSLVLCRLLIYVERAPRAPRAKVDEKRTLRARTIASRIRTQCIQLSQPELAEN